MVMLRVVLVLSPQLLLMLLLLPVFQTAAAAAAHLLRASWNSLTTLSFMPTAMPNMVLYSAVREAGRCEVPYNSTAGEEVRLAASVQPALLLLRCVCLHRLFTCMYSSQCGIQ